MIQNETTLVIGLPGMGKSRLAYYASKNIEKVTVISNFGEDFPNCYSTNSFEDILEYEKVCFVDDDIVNNEIAMLISYKMKNRMLIIDEAHLYQESEILNKILRYGRHNKIDIILLSQSLFDYERVNRHLIQNILVMKMTDSQGRGDNYEINRLESIDPNSQIRKIEQYNFIILKGELPKFFNKKDLTITNNFYRLKEDAVKF